jgi:hypothetical protein
MNKHPNQPCGPGKGTIFPGPFSQLSKGKIDEKQLFKFFSSFFSFSFYLFIYLFIFAEGQFKINIHKLHV